MTAFGTKIFKSLDKEFIQKFFRSKQKLFFPLEKGTITGLEIKKTSPVWAKKTCLARYKIFFSGGGSKIVRGTAKVDGSKKWSYKIMKHLYENGFDKGAFIVPRPLCYIGKIGLFIYEESPGEPLASIIEKNQYTLKLSNDLVEFLFKIHSLKARGFKKPALIFDTSDYLKIYKKIKKIFPKIAPAFPLKKLHLIEVSEDKSSFIHGDFYTGNLVIDGNKIALIDFDKTGFGPILYDLASFCYCFEFPQSIWPLNLPESKVKKYQNDFLEKYAEMANYNLIEMKGALNKYMAKVYLNGLNYYADLDYKSWNLLAKKEKKAYFAQITALAKKADLYLQKYKNFVRGN